MAASRTRSLACGLLSIGSQMQIPVTRIELVQSGVIDVDLDSPYVYGVETASRVFTSTLGRMNTEFVGLLCLDSTHKVIGYSTVAMGSVDRVTPSVAQILRTALLSNASYIVVAHNHPSGVCEITEPDIALTKRIGGAAQLMDISLIDSLVVCPSGEFASIRESMGRD